jgi:hypothetical protein
MERTAIKSDVNETPGADGDGTNGACICGIVSQHSWLWPGEEQGMDWQHFIAWAGVVVPEQSET